MATKTLILDSNIRPQAWSGDINDDGLDDFAFFEFSTSSTELEGLQFLVSNGDEFDQKTVQLSSSETFKVNAPKLMFADINGDDRNEFVVYDNAGWNVAAGSGVGRIPYVFSFDGQRFASSDLLAKAYSELVGVPNTGQTDATVSFKDYDIADIDGDGDLDLWVESTGSMNVMGHFVVNEGSRFQIDRDERLDGQLYFNTIPDFTTRWNIGRFHDINNDGYADLFLGALDSRSNGNPVHASAVLLNDGNGNFDNEGLNRLPRPAFNNGNSKVTGVSFGYINGDGLKDVVIAHSHENAAGTVTGTSLQVLLQKPDGTFADQTTTYIADQSMLVNSGLSIRNITLQDVNLDGQQDIFVDYNFSTLTAAIPNYFVKLADQRFLAGSSRLYEAGAVGVETVLRNLNRDQFLDAVTIDYGNNFELYSQGQSRLTLTYGDEGSLLATFPGRNNAELLSGTAGSDKIYGFGGDDTVMGSGGDDYIDAGSGVDTLAIAYKVSELTSMGFAADGKSVVLTAPDGRDTLVNIEAVQFADQTLDLYGLRSVLAPDLAFSVVRDGVSTSAMPVFFTGLTSLNLHYQLIDTTPDVVVVGSSLNDFIALQGGGVKAVDAGTGDDVIDGGVGSTFITGGGGSNTFFLDGRAQGTSWSTITDFQLGQDKATIWGWKAGVSRIQKIEASGGADGYTGVTFHFENLLPDGSPDGASNAQVNSLTFSGRTLADFGVSSVSELNQQVLEGTADFFVVGQTEDIYGLHGYLYVA